MTVVRSSRILCLDVLVNVKGPKEFYFPHKEEFLLYLKILFSISSKRRTYKNITKFWEEIRFVNVKVYPKGLRGWRERSRPRYQTKGRFWK